MARWLRGLVLMEQVLTRRACWVLMELLFSHEGGSCDRGPPVQPNRYACPDPQDTVVARSRRLIRASSTAVIINPFIFPDLSQSNVLFSGRNVPNQT